MKDGKTHTFDLTSIGLPVKLMLFGGEGRAEITKTIEEANAARGLAALRSHFGSPHEHQAVVTEGAPGRRRVGLRGCCDEIPELEQRRKAMCVGRGRWGLCGRWGYAVEGGSVGIDRARERSQ